MTTVNVETIEKCVKTTHMSLHVLEAGIDAVHDFLELITRWRESRILQPLREMIRLSEMFETKLDIIADLG